MPWSGGPRAVSDAFVAGASEQAERAQGDGQPRDILSSTRKGINADPASRGCADTDSRLCADRGPPGYARSPGTPRHLAHARDSEPAVLDRPASRGTTVAVVEPDFTPLYSYAGPAEALALSSSSFYTYGGAGPAVGPPMTSLAIRCSCPTQLRRFSSQLVARRSANSSVASVASRPPNSALWWSARRFDVRASMPLWWMR